MEMSKLKGVLGRLLQFAAVTAGFFLWWMAMFLLISLFALNIWAPKWMDLVRWSLILTAVSGLVYLAVMIRRGRR